VTDAILCTRSNDVYLISEEVFNSLHGQVRIYQTTHSLDCKNQETFSSGHTVYFLTLSRRWMTSHIHHDGKYYFLVENDWNSKNDNENIYKHLLPVKQNFTQRNCKSTMYFHICFQWLSIWIGWKLLWNNRSTNFAFEKN
jgi:hypothetical protein